MNQRRTANRYKRPVTPGQIVARGMTMRCPNCGSRTLFSGLLRMSDCCSVCGLVFEKEEGFFLGAMVFSYTLTTLIAGVVPCIALLAGLAQAPQRDQVALFGGAIAAALILPFVFYRPSKSLWLMTYYAFVPDELLANGAILNEQSGPGKEEVW